MAVNTAVSAWPEARHTLPFVFADGSVTRAGALAAAVLPPASAGTTRGVALAGAALEGVATVTMERSLADSSHGAPVPTAAWPEAMINRRAQLTTAPPVGNCWLARARRQRSDSPDLTRVVDQAGTGALLAVGGEQ